MEELIDENTMSMARLLREMRSLTAQQETYRKKQMSKFRERQEFELNEADEMREKIKAEQVALENDTAALRDEIELTIKIMCDNLAKDHEAHQAKLRELEQAIESDRIGTVEKIENHNASIDAQKKKVRRELDELHEASKRLMDNPDGDATEAPDVEMEMEQQAPRPPAKKPSPEKSPVEMKPLAPKSPPEKPPADEPGISTRACSGNKRAASDRSTAGARNPTMKRSRHSYTSFIQDAETEEDSDVPMKSPQDAQHSPDEQPSPVPKTTQSAQRPKGLILAAWQKDRLVTYADIRGKEYVYIRHNVPRVLRCPNCPGFQVWPVRPTIKGHDKAHFTNSEFHKHQRAMDGDVGPGRGREDGAGITSDWITRNFGWRVVEDVPKGSLDDWALHHNDEVDRCRNGELIRDIVFQPDENMEAQERLEGKMRSWSAGKRTSRSRSSMSGMEPITPATATHSEGHSPERKVAGSPESVTRAAAREGGYSMRNIARRNYTVPGMDDIRDKEIK